MKKQVLMMILLALASIAQAQYYYIPFAVGKNPRNLNQDGENPAPLLTGWSTVWSGDATAAAQLTNRITIPFPFTFNGNTYTSCRASNTGFVTFDSAATPTLSYGNAALPSANVPNNSICFLGVKPSSWVSGSTTYRSTIVTKTFGTAPNRQFWIQYNFFSEPNVDRGWTYWSAVLEETTNKVYIVDMKTLCVTSSGSLCSGNVKISAGLQINATTAISIDGSPNLAANNNSTNLFTPADNKYYEFIAGSQPNLDLSAQEVLMLPDFALTQTSMDVKIKVFNGGSQAINSVTLNYSVDNGTPVSQQITGLNIAKFAFADLTHPTKWAPAATGTYNLKIWTDQPNAGTDGDPANDTILFTVKVWEDFVPRKSLHEVFTSSTCPPCKPGNEQLDAVLAGKDNLYTVIKYQYFFPGLGDPYFTPECDTRATYYGGVNSVPRMFVDGQWNANPSSYNNSLFASFQSKPSFVRIEASQVLDPAAKSITLNAKVTPLIDFPAGNYRLRFAVVERTTFRNIKNNGETEFHYVMKKMLPNATGVAFTMPAKGTMVESNQPYTFPGSYKLAPSSRFNSSGAASGTNYAGINLATEHSVEEFDDLIGVVFLQNETTKEVLQSEWTSPNWAVSAKEVVIEKLGLQIFPNPASQSFTIQIAAEHMGKQFAVIITDIKGKQVLNQQIDGLTNQEIDCNHLQNGVYFVTITNGTETSTQKLIIAK